MSDRSALPPRYCADRPLPPYSYVPGMHPHPVSDPAGHSFSRTMPAVPHPDVSPLTDNGWTSNATWLYASDLFNHGYYWEAHEAWESLWHAAGKRGTTADFLKGLIKLAAAGVKGREGRPEGVRRHALRAIELLEQVEAACSEQRRFGVEISLLLAIARAAADRPAEVVDTRNQPAARVLPPIELGLPT